MILISSLYDSTSISTCFFLLLFCHFVTQFLLNLHSKLTLTHTQTHTHTHKYNNHSLVRFEPEKQKKKKKVANIKGNNWHAGPTSSGRAAGGVGLAGERGLGRVARALDPLLLRRAVPAHIINKLATRSMSNNKPLFIMLFLAFRFVCLPCRSVVIDYGSFCCCCCCIFCKIYFFAQQQHISIQYV